MESNVLTRQELYELVWSEPISGITSKYQITVNLIHKVCREMSVPLPGPGYWSKRRYSNTVEWDELPSPYTGKNQVRLSAEDDTNPLVAKQKEIMADKRVNLIVSHNLTNPDPLVLSAKENLDRHIENYRYKGLVNCEQDNLDIRVSKNNIGRALKILDTLIKAVKIRGHKIEIRYGNTCIVVLGHSIEVKLREQTKRIPSKDTWQSGEYIPTGKLYMKVGHGYYEIYFKDGKQPVEKQLPLILANIEIMGEREHQEAIEHERKEQIRKAMELDRLLLENRKRTELARFRELLVKAKRMDQTLVIRNYIDVVEENAVSTNRMNPKLQEWIDWAKHKADWYDPMIEKQDELLSGVDRNTLSIS